MKVAALFPVGQTPGGCVAAIQEILKTEQLVDVYLLHGTLAAGQVSKDPRDAAQEIAETDFNGRAAFKAIEPIDTFNLEAAYKTAREMVHRIETEHYDRVFAGITGGANPLVASVFHAAVAYLDTEVVPIYSQGKGESTERVFVAPDIRLSVIADSAIRLARSGQLGQASFLASTLPKRGEWQFLQQGLEALAAWDDFDYQRARDLIRRIVRYCEQHATSGLLSKLSATVARLRQVGDEMVKLTSEFRDVDQFAKRASRPDWPSHVRSGGELLVADALANAERRFGQTRYTDCVLRAYRAAECATQVRLFELGIHPSRPDSTNDAPLGFRAGLARLGDRGKIDCSQINKQLKDLMQLRNNSYLEHGYVRVEIEGAQRCLDHGKSLCKYLLGPAVISKAKDFELSV